MRVRHKSMAHPFIICNIFACVHDTGIYIDPKQIAQFVERKDGQHDQQTGDDRHVNGILQVTLRTLQ